MMLPLRLMYRSPCPIQPIVVCVGGSTKIHGFRQSRLGVVDHSLACLLTKRGEIAMFGIKKLIMGLFIGLLLGLWAGVNIGHGRPVWSNPFEEPALMEKAKKAVREKLND